MAAFLLRLTDAAATAIDGGPSPCARSSCETLPRQAWIGMTLNTIERDFLTRLSLEPWTSPPVFDYGLIDRLVRDGV
jgi:hypothetical protein